MVEDLPWETQLPPTDGVISELGRQSFAAVVRQDNLELRAGILPQEPEAEAVILTPVLEGNRVLANPDAPASGYIIHHHHTIADCAKGRQTIGQDHAFDD